MNHSWEAVSGKIFLGEEELEGKDLDFAAMKNGGCPHRVGKNNKTGANTRGGGMAVRHQSHEVQGKEATRGKGVWV